VKLKHIAISVYLAAVGLAATLTPVFAQVPTCQFGVQVGGSIASTQLSDATDSIDGAGARSTRPDAGARIGCDLPVGTAFKVGAFGEWNYQDVAFSVTSGPFGFSGALGNSYSVGARAGVMVGSAFPYVLIAWTHSDANWSVSAPFSLTGSGLPTSFQGTTYGGGIEIPLRDTPLSLALETRWTRYNAEAIGASGVDLRPDQLQGMLRLNWNFGETPKAAKPLK